ncbi:hypothetical protein OAT67_04840 [Bacteriovoracaceae bacterium]|nr:hypothetical protein [Bacteriovoracaceae bacterium]
MVGFKYYFLIFTILLSHTSNAQLDIDESLLNMDESQKSTSIDDPIEAFKTIRKAYKEQRKQEKLKEKENDNLIQLEVCVSCNKLNPLINEVNQVLKVMIETKQVDPTIVGAVEQIEKLEAMYIISEHHESQASLPVNDENCQISPGEVYLRDPMRERILEEDLIQIMSFNIPLHKLMSIHIKDPLEKSRTYYYQAAKPNDNIIIRVYVPTEGAPTVQYLYKGDIEDLKRRIKIEAHRKKLADELRAKNKENSEDKKEDNYWGGLATYEGDNSSWEAGLAIEHKNNLPRKLVLLRGKDRTEIFENTYISSEVEVSDRRQKFKLGLSDGENSYFNVKVKADGRYYAEVPFELRTQTISLTDGVLATSGKVDEVRAGIKYENIQLFHLSGVSNRENNDHSISVNKNIYSSQNNGVVSMQFKDERVQGTKEQSMWIRYTLDF